MLGACVKACSAADKYACHTLKNFGYVDRLAIGLLLSVYDYVVEDAISGEIEGNTGVNSISCSISPAVY